LRFFLYYLVTTSSLLPNQRSVVSPNSSRLFLLQSPPPPPIFTPPRLQPPPYTPPPSLHPIAPFPLFGRPVGLILIAIPVRVIVFHGPLFHFVMFLPSCSYPSEVFSTLLFWRLRAALHSSGSTSTHSPLRSVRPDNAPHAGWQPVLFM